jgi:hypothetical protein
MKFFIQIFTIYMFCLSFAPCGESGGVVELFDLLIGQKVLVAQQDANSDNNTTPCSPFCICSNCVPILYMPESGVVLPNDKNGIEPKTSPFYAPFYLPSSFHNDIWQPPKLG